jgi:hypothetical protein
MRYAIMFSRNYEQKKGIEAYLLFKLIGSRFIVQGSKVAIDLK